MGDSEREQNVFMAKLAEQAERYEEMVDYMKNVAKQDVELTIEERNYLSVAYKNVIGARRASWRIITSIMGKEENKKHIEKIQEYKTRVEQELERICADILDILKKHLIPSSKSGESKVFHYKMQGDYFRYLAEFSTNDKKKSTANESLNAYKTATQIAETELSTTHPIRLGLALNFSVFYYEIMNSPETACKLAKKAFDEAVADIDTLTDESYKDSTFILQLLRDNLTLWNSDLQGKDQDDENNEEENNAENDNNND